jgi:hypothetical protein
VRNLLASAVLALAAIPALRGADEELARFSVVAVKPANVSIIIGTVSMTFAPFARRNTVYSSSYSAKVFPFFYSERGRIWIVIPDEDLRRASRGEVVDFKGHALDDSGDDRRIEGRVTPTGPREGKIRVRVFVTRRISLTYDTTYELRGADGPQAAVIPR